MEEAEDMSRAARRSLSLIKILAKQYRKELKHHAELLRWKKAQAQKTWRRARNALNGTLAATRARAYREQEELGWSEDEEEGTLEWVQQQCRRTHISSLWGIPMCLYLKCDAEGQVGLADFIGALGKFGINVTIEQLLRPPSREEGEAPLALLFRTDFDKERATRDAEADGGVELTQEQAEAEAVEMLERRLANRECNFVELDRLLFPDNQPPEPEPEPEEEVVPEEEVAAAAAAGSEDVWTDDGPSEDSDDYGPSPAEDSEGEPLDAQGKQERKRRKRRKRRRARYRKAKKKAKKEAALATPTTTPATTPAPTPAVNVII